MITKIYKIEHYSHCVGVKHIIFYLAIPKTSQTGTFPDFRKSNALPTTTRNIILQVYYNPHKQIPGQ